MPSIHSPQTTSFNYAQKCCIVIAIGEVVSNDQKVKFIGGKEIMRRSSSEGGTWKYLVKMPQGKQPTFLGRAGAEKVFLNERELRAA